MQDNIPVYLFTGFMDSGKTSLIEETLFENDFTDGAKGLIIMCEDGDCEYDIEKLNKVNFDVVEIESEADFTPERLKELADKYQPEQVFIEYNGTWPISHILEIELPVQWMIVQTLSTVDANTFMMYMQNMRAMMQEQLICSDVVIFNRCDESVDKRQFRMNIKGFNRKAQIVYEREDGSLDDTPEELPFDLDQDIIEISDADYAIWYMDVMENYKKYNNKKVKFRALVANPDKLKKGIFIPGRFVMTCCVEDITFIGLKAKYPNEDQIPDKSWIDLTAKIKIEFDMGYKGKGPVLYPISIEPAEKPEDDLVYFS
ncbi:GTP-binding protein [Lachnobacterium bovis]|uniref:TIGR03943 family putative permease subunit n=1 Tax=Lachnobacterium bovis TaxID=140626 RepID=UPI00048666E7|nr:GTP-binding protein [Lachnobacterium bovis]